MTYQRSSCNFVICLPSAFRRASRRPLSLHRYRLALQCHIALRQCVPRD